VRIYCGVHCIQDAKSGFAITLATEIAMRGNWVMGRENVATHCFVIYQEDNSRMWRLDATPDLGGARWRAIDTFPKDIPVAIWLVSDDYFENERCPEAPALSPNAVAMLDKGRALDGTLYDWFEIRNQAIVAASYAFSMLPFFTKLRLVGSASGIDHAMICTRATQTTALVGLKNKPLETLSALPDLLPERFAQTMRAAEGDWTVRRR
jgi:hypothetical protein